MEYKKNAPYGNCKVLNKNGELIFRCGNKKAKWYLSRNLAKIIEPFPNLVIQLNFEANGPGNKGDAYLLGDKENRCVCCGILNGLTLHHVVPYCFRKFFPEQFKNHNCYDVLILCKVCHQKYEEESNILRNQIAQELGLSINGNSIEVDVEKSKVRKAGSALLNYGHQIPEPRNSLLRNVIKNYFELEEIDEKDIERASKLNFRISNEDYLNFAEFVVKNTNLNEFIIRWRTHFINTMNPKFLSKEWKIER